MTSERASMLRERTGPQRVTNVELFFDLVFVFAVTQISHYLLTRAAGGGGVRIALLAALLLAMVWLHSAIGGRLSAKRT